MKRTLFCFAVALLIGCGETPDESAPFESTSHALGKSSRAGFTVLTHNLYVGASVERILASPTPEDLPLRVAQAFQMVQATRFAERAMALAEEVASTRPHLIGLQEVSLFRVQSPGDFFQSPSQPATKVAFDHLEIFLQALKARGLRYRLVAVVEDADVELPSATGDDIRLTDRDVLLAREDVLTWSPRSGHYQAKLQIPFGPLSVEVTRGWVAVNAWVGNRPIRFVNTHLEPAPTPELAPIQMAQAAELLASLHGEIWPIVMVGDFNSAADGSNTETYALLRSFGFQDSWLSSGASTAGNTCCQAEDLRNADSALNERIDLVLTRKSLLLPIGLPLQVAGAKVLGASPEEKTASGLWPSDHAGVAVEFSRKSK